MIIRKIRIENFGHFHDFTLELGPGLNRLRRGNEFGKTTFLEFIRRVLWGFPKGKLSAQLNRYPARYTAGEYGGSLEVELSDGSAAVLERRGDKGELIVRNPDGSEASGEAFLRKLTPISGKCYHDVYAVTLDELEKLSALDDEEIRGRLYGGSITAGDIPLPELGRRFDSRCKELYKQRNGASEIRDAREDLREAVDAQARTVAQVARRAELEKARSDLAEKSAKVQKEADAVAAAVAGVEPLLKAYPIHSKLRELAARLAAEPETPEVSERTALRAEELTRNLETAKREFGGGEAPKPDQIKELEELIASYNRDLAERSTGEIPLPSDEDIRTASELAEDAAGLVTPPRFPLWGCLAVPLLVAAALLLKLFLPSAAGGAIGSAVLAAAAAVWSFVVYRRKVAEHRRRVEAHTARTEELRNKFRLTCPSELFVPTLTLRSRRECLDAELWLLRRNLADHARVADLSRELDELCKTCHCVDAAAVRRLADRSAELAELRRRRAEVEAALAAVLPPERRNELDGFAPETALRRRTEAEQRAAELKRELYLLHQQSGAVANELKHLPDDLAVGLAAAGVEQARGALREKVREYLTVRGAREFLTAAIDRYEKESQPEVIKGAEKLFAGFTSGRYPRLYKNVSSGKLLACDRDTGLEKDFNALSRGTREELMLAMRLALIEHIERDSEALPVVFDDVGVNFDAARLAAVEKAVESFAAGRQVIWFSHS